MRRRQRTSTSLPLASRSVPFTPLIRRALASERGPVTWPVAVLLCIESISTAEDLHVVGRRPIDAAPIAGGVRRRFRYSLSRLSGSGLMLQ